MCVCVCVCVCMYVCMNPCSVYACKYAFMYHIYAYHTHTHAHIQRHIHTYTCIYILVNKCISTNIRRGGRQEAERDTHMRGRGGRHSAGRRPQDPAVEKQTRQSHSTKFVGPSKLPPTSGAHPQKPLGKRRVRRQASMWHPRCPHF
jgi:hypothetical protein